MRSKLLMPLACLSALCVLITACDGDGSGSGDDTQPPTAVPTMTSGPSTVTPGGGGGGDIPRTSVPVLTPLATPSVSPSGWKQQQVPATEANDAFSFAYPPSWFVQHASTVILVSYDQATQSGWPADGVFSKIDFTYCKIGSSGCELLPGGSPVKVDGNSGFEARFTYEPDADGRPTRSRVVQFQRDGFAYGIVGYFGPNVPESDTTFEQIIGSVEFER